MISKLIKPFIGLFIALLLSLTSIPAISYAADSDEITITLNSKYECAAGCIYDVYQLLELPDGDENAAVYAKEITPTIIDPTANPIASEATRRLYARNTGSDELDYDYLTDLVNRVEYAGIKPIATARVDMKPAELPGPGVYLLVMRNWEDIPSAYIEHNYNTDELTDAEKEANLYNITRFYTATYKDDTEGIIASKAENSGIMLTDPDNKRLYKEKAEITSHYQPENVPEEVIEAKTVKEEKKQVAEAKAGSGDLLGVFTPLLIIAGVIVLFMFLNKRKRSYKDNEPAKNNVPSTPHSSDTSNDPDQDQSNDMDDNKADTDGSKDQNDTSSDDRPSDKEPDIDTTIHDMEEQRYNAKVKVDDLNNKLEGAMFMDPDAYQQLEDDRDIAEVEYEQLSNMLEFLYSKKLSSGEEE